MNGVPRIGIATTLSLVLAQAAAAQPTLTVSTSIVTPGQPVTLTLNEPSGAGKQYAFIASAYGAGFSYAGTQLAVGPDVVILEIGTLPGSATATFAFTPPFRGTTLDRYYVQAVTSANAVFNPLMASNGVVLRNADLVGGINLIGSGTASDAPVDEGNNYIMATSSFVADRDRACLVTTSLQYQPLSAHVSHGSILGVFRNAISRNGIYYEDGSYGQTVISNGVVNPQGVFTHVSALTIRAGETIRFGALFRGPDISGRAWVQTGYICS